MEDLDTLLQDLETNPSQSANNRGSVMQRSARTSTATTPQDLDELSALMNDLNAGAAAGTRTSAAPVSRPAATSNAPPPQQNRASQVNRITSVDMGKSMEDLDALMNSLGGPAPGPGARASQALNQNGSPARSSVAPAAQARASAAPSTSSQSRPQSTAMKSDFDDLDALVNSLEPQQQRQSVAAKPAAASQAQPRAAAAPAPQQQRATASVASSRPQSMNTGNMDDLDALMNDLGNLSSAAPSTRTSVAPQPAAAATRAPGRPQSMLGNENDLDSLMLSLGSGGAPPPAATKPAAKAAPAPAAASPKPAAANNRAGQRQSQMPDDLDALMNSLGPAGGPAAPAATAPAKQAPLRPAGGAAKPAAAPRDDLSHLIGNLSNQIGNDPSAVAALDSKGVCATCRQPVLGEVMTAMGKVFHMDHFVCSNCQDPIGTKTFFEFEGAPQCERCYNAMFCPKCAYCDQPVTDRCITALGKKWHINHFICTQCLQPFPRGIFFERDGKPYCETDFYDVYAPKCAGCDKPIHSDAVNAMGLQWHPEHFACTYCGKSFAGEPFYEFGGKPYCEAHYHQQSGALCAGCHKAIAGRVVSALDKKWHPEHFVCSFCMNPLAGGAYTERQGKPYCKGCTSKLFG